MKAIWKYPLEPVDAPQDVEMPKGAGVIHVHRQGGLPCLWAVVDTDAPTQTRRFTVRGTGDPLQGTDRHYLGTCHIDPFVWHVFEWSDAPIPV